MLKYMVLAIQDHVLSHTNFSNEMVFVLCYAIKYTRTKIS